MTKRTLDIKDVHKIVFIVIKGILNHVLFTVLSWLLVLLIEQVTAGYVATKKHYAIFIVLFLFI